MGCGEGKNPPVTASPCQPPLGKGAVETGMRIATPVTWFLQGVRWGLFYRSLLHFSRFCGILGVFNLTLKEFSPWKP